MELFVNIEDFSQPHELLTKGRFDDGTSQVLSYSLCIDALQQTVFTFEDIDGKTDVLRSEKRIWAGLL